MADALSRVEEIKNPMDYEALAAFQKKDEELKQILQGSSSLKLKLFKVPGSDAFIFCDVTTRTARPFITREFRRAAFNSVHRLSHPSIRSTVKLVTQRYV